MENTNFLSSTLIDNNISASACSQIGMLSPVIEKGEVNYNKDASISGYILIDSTLLSDVELKIEGGNETTTHFYPLNTENAIKDKIVQVKRVQMNDIVDVQLYRIDFHLSSKELDIPIGEYHAGIFALSTSTFCGDPLNISTESINIKIEDTYYSKWNEKKEIGLEHNFTIKFNQEIDQETVSNTNIYIKHNLSNIVEGVKVSLNADKRSITINAPKLGYIGGEEYFIHIDKEVQSISGKQLQPIKMKFTTVSNPILDVGKTYEGIVFSNFEKRYTVNITSLNQHTGEFKGDFQWDFPSR